MTLYAISTGPAFPSDKLSLSSLDVDVRKDAVNRFMKSVDLADAVVISLNRGRVINEYKRSKRHQSFVEEINTLCEKQIPEQSLS